jgi:restrictase
MEYKDKHQTIFYGSPGCALDMAIRKAIREWGEQKEIDEKDFRLFHTTFHPATTYDDFVSTEKTHTQKNITILECVSKVFMQAYKAACSKDTPVILIIKDIHRGDVPKIFGEFYSLLDRKNGESEYPIGVNDKPKITTFHSLPSNFYIWATMTTGEEAAFAMDHAFQRKWYWEYVPFNIENSRNFDIEIGGNSYQWYDILKAINDVIFRYTHSEELLVGELFIDDEKNYYIWKSSDFKNFVMRHLWYTFCKDNYGTDKNFFRYQDHQFKGATVEFTFQQLFTSNGDDILEKFLEFIGCSPV